MQNFKLTAERRNQLFIEEINNLVERQENNQSQIQKQIEDIQTKESLKRELQFKDIQQRQKKILESFDEFEKMKLSINKSSKDALLFVEQKINDLKQNNQTQLLQTSQALQEFQDKNFRKEFKAIENMNEANAWLTQNVLDALSNFNDPVVAQKNAIDVLHKKIGQVSTEMNKKFESNQRLYKQLIWTVIIIGVILLIFN